MLSMTFRLTLMLLLTVFMSESLCAEESSASQRLQSAQEFHRRATEPTGILVPMYLYPANVHTNAAYNQLIDLKRRYETVPMWVVINPASGPGQAVDQNYVKAIDRLKGAGCVVLGYVATTYGKRASVEVQKEIDLWIKMYPEIQGIFFDEMIYVDNNAAAEYQIKLNDYAHKVGCWPTVANPGTDAPGRYFVNNAAADVIIIHETGSWPQEKRLKGDYFGGYSDFPPFTRAVLMHSISKFDPGKIKMIRKYARWIYVTQAPFRANDPTAANPWNVLSKHMEALCESLSSSKAN